MRTRHLLMIVIFVLAAVAVVIMWSTESSPPGVQVLSRFDPDTAKIPPEHQKVLADVSRFREVYSTTNLPSALVAICADRNGRIAQPGQKWNPTDVVIDESAPQSRLIWGATDDDYYVVHYERGGYGHSFRFLVVRLKAGESKPSFIWRGVGLGLTGPLKNYSAFLEALQSGKLDDSLDVH